MDYPGIEELINKGEKQCPGGQNMTMFVLITLLVIVGLFGNAVEFFVILVLKEYRKSVSNWYVLQLATADTLFLLMLPFSASEHMNGRWDFSEALCKTKDGIIMVNYYASILFLTMMSFDRYMAVTKSGVSKWADVLRRLRSAALISLIIWIVSICLASPLYIYSHVNDCHECTYNFPLLDSERCETANIHPTNCSKWIKEEDEAVQNLTSPDYTNVGDFNSDYSILGIDGEELLVLLANFSKISKSNWTEPEEICTYSPPRRSHTLWLYLNFSLLLVLPFVLICIFYGLILRAMMGTTTTASTNQRQYRRRVTFMVLALVSLFAISWVPWYAVMMARIPGFPLSEKGCGVLISFVTLLSYLNSALNPYFYSFMGSRFHQRFLRARTTATRRSRFFSYLSRASWRHDSSHSHSGSCRTPQNGKEIKLTKVKKSQSEDESFNTKSNLRTERTMMDPPTSP